MKKKYILNFVVKITVIKKKWSKKLKLWKLTRKSLQQSLQISSFVYFALLLNWCLSFLMRFVRIANELMKSKVHERSYHFFTHELLNLNFVTVSREEVSYRDNFFFLYLFFKRETDCIFFARHSGFAMLHYKYSQVLKSCRNSIIWEQAIIYRILVSRVMKSRTTQRRCVSITTRNVKYRCKAKLF